MNLEFSGILKDGCDASSLFEQFEVYGLYYNVDVISGNIIVEGIKPENRNTIVWEVNKVFEIFHIRATETADDNNASVIEIEKYDMLFEKLRETLLSKQLPQDVLETCIHNMILDASLFSTNRRKINEGEIVSCNFGFGLPSENYSYMDVLVLRHTEKKKYLVVPVKLKSNLSDNGGFCMRIRRNLDATYYNPTYEKDEAIILLNRIQEVHISRLSMSRGAVTKYFLNSVYKRLYSCNYEKPSLNTVIEELVAPAVKCIKKDETECQQLDSFFEFVKIPNELMFLREVFFNALVIKSATLKDLIPQLQIDNDLILSKNAVQTKLRKEFVIWLDSIYPNIFEEYDRISLADVLKVFLKCYYELN